VGVKEGCVRRCEGAESYVTGSESFGGIWEEGWRCSDEVTFWFTGSHF